MNKFILLINNTPMQPQKSSNSDQQHSSHLFGQRTDSPTRRDRNAKVSSPEQKKTPPSGGKKMPPITGQESGSSLSPSKGESKLGPENILDLSKVHDPASISSKLGPENILDLSVIKAEQVGFSTQIICEEVTLEQPGRKDSIQTSDLPSDLADAAKKLGDTESDSPGQKSSKRANPNASNFEIAANQAMRRQSPGKTHSYSCGSASQEESRERLTKLDMNTKLNVPAFNQLNEAAAEKIETQLGKRSSAIQSNEVLKKQIQPEEPVPTLRAIEIDPNPRGGVRRRRFEQAQRQKGLSRKISASPHQRVLANDQLRTLFSRNDERDTEEQYQGLLTLQMEK